MGLFDIFKNKNEEKDSPKKMVLVDNVYLIDVPDTWNQFESDRFRMTNADKTINLSVTNYAKDVSADHLFTIEDLKRQTLPLFERFVNEGGYEKHNDLEIGNNYVYQAFKVDHETQYYYYTHRLINSTLFVMIAFILKEQGGYREATRDKLKAIGDSIKHKVANI